MKTLILMRHAKSDWSSGQPDHERGLNARGRQSAKAMGDWLRDRGILPDTTLISDATRTRETWDLLALDCDPDFRPALYHANAEKTLEMIRLAEGDVMLVLAHNPDIAELANRLVQEPPSDPEFEDYPTCATTIMSFDVDEWSDVNEAQGKLVTFQIPRAVIRQS